MTHPDLFDVLEKATNHGLTMAESGPLTERAPEPEAKRRAPRPRLSGTFRIGEIQRGDVLSSYLAQEAHQKRVAAERIREVALSLRELKCPADLMRRVEHAAQDKLKHAEILTQAGAISQRATDVSDDGSPQMDLWQLTLSTATERCVVDVYAAARFAFQARRAESAELASVFFDIARDDAVHVSLFWELMGWALSHLSPARARLLAEEQRKVREALREAIEAPLPVEIHEIAGVPDADAAHAILDSLEFELWSDVAA